MATSGRTLKAECRYINPNPPPGGGLSASPDPKQYALARQLLTIKHEIVFHDARAAEGGLGFWKFDTHGLACVTPPPPVDFEDDELVKKEHYPKIAELAKRVSGAKDCFVTSHLTREPNPKFVYQNPARFAHCDGSKDTPPSWRKLLHKKYGCSLEYLDTHDLCMVNVWYPRDIPAYKDPLCILDNTTVDLEKDVVIIPYVDKNGVTDTRITIGNLVGPSYNPNHRWVYISDQKPEEAWIFKQFDEREGVAKQCFHNSFHDPFYDNDPSKPGRRSVEFRMFLSFPKSQSKL